MRAAWTQDAVEGGSSSQSLPRRTWGGRIGPEITDAEASNAVGADAVDGDQDDCEFESGVQVGVGVRAVEAVFVLVAEAAADPEVEAFLGRRFEVPVGARVRAPT